MEGIPVGFLLLLAGLCVVALVVALVAYGLKQRRLQRLKSPAATICAAADPPRSLRAPHRG